MPNLGSRFETFGMLSGSGGGSNLIEEANNVMAAMGSPCLIFDGDQAFSMSGQQIVGALCTGQGNVLNGTDITISNNSSLSSLGMPDISQYDDGTFNFSGNALEVIDLSSFVTLGLFGTVNIQIISFASNIPLASCPFEVLLQMNHGTINMGACGLITCAFPTLDTINASSILLAGCTSLISITFPLLAHLQGAGCTLDFSGCALPHTMVDAICIKLAANYGGATGTLDFSGGTNGKPSKTISSITIDSPGIGYTEGDPIILGGVILGTGFTGHVSVDESGLIIGAIIDSPGSGYTDDLTFNVVSGTGMLGSLSGVFSDSSSIAVLKAGGGGFTVITN